MVDLRPPEPPFGMVIAQSIKVVYHPLAKACAHLGLAPQVCGALLDSHVFPCVPCAQLIALHDSAVLLETDGFLFSAGDGHFPLSKHAANIKLNLNVSPERGLGFRLRRECAFRHPDRQISWIARQGMCFASPDSDRFIKRRKVPWGVRMS